VRHGAAAAYESHAKPILPDSYQLILDNTFLYSLFIACKDIKKIFSKQIIWQKMTKSKEIIRQKLTKSKEIMHLVRELSPFFFDFAAPKFGNFKD
jgi:hypothetical protein